MMIKVTVTESRV